MVLNFSNCFVWVYIAGAAVTFIAGHILEYIDYAARKKNGGVIPEALRNIEAAENAFDEEKLKKITSYENEKYFFWIPKSILSTALNFCLVLFGFYPFVFSKLLTTGFVNPNSFLHIFLFMLIIGLPSTLLGIPFDIYRHFKLEKKYGFSNMTLKTWILDLIKGFAVSVVLSFILVFAVTFILNKFPSNWWILVASVMIAFSFIMMIIYPKFIAPLFNKFSPLEEGELKTKIQALLEKTGFVNDGLFVMDASKRSNHSNAYFSGFGKTKRIVLYDTLIKQLTTDELVAVLGHELGHYKLKHILKRVLFILPMEFVMMFVLYLLSQNVELYNSFGFMMVNETNIVNYQFVGLYLSMLLYEAVSFAATPLSGIMSRRDEYQADKYAAQICGNSKDLISALIKLNSENLSELLPPKIYSFFMYDHPTLVERVNALKKM
ncbi:MAG: M48 family metallopeptidase [Treponema sp.]|uniref:M48 family metallopeptidase n=1 Tax=Treponema sp. TaxID=166 RepID=UPI00298D9694|nr:M48 family metallopeptidase [Treponema sp.]MBR5932445.1 M48 family metallopeptidase [Treponema sp.]